MTYNLKLNFNKNNYIVVDDDNPEGLSALKSLFGLPEKTTEIRLYGIDAEYFVEENPSE
jgi:hypothetical protein